MGLLAGISVFSIIEIVVTIVKSFRFAVCKSRVDPQVDQRPRIQKKFLVNKKHIFYHLSKSFSELTKESNVHGVHYTSNKRLHVIERIFWFIIICVLLAFCSVLVLDSLSNLRSNSVIVTLDDKIWSVEDVSLQRLFFSSLYYGPNM